METCRSAWYHMSDIDDGSLSRKHSQTRKHTCEGRYFICASLFSFSSFFHITYTTSFHTIAPPHSPTIYNSILRKYYASSCLSTEMGSQPSKEVEETASAVPAVVAAAPPVEEASKSVIILPTMDTDENATAIYNEVTSHVQAIQDLVKPGKDGLTEAQAKAIQTGIKDQMISFGTEVHGAVLKAAFRANKKLEDDNTELRGRIKTLNTNLFDLATEHNHVTVTLETTQQVLEDRTDRIKVLSDRIITLEGRLAAHDAADAQIDRHIHKQKAIIDNLNAQIHTLKHEKADFLSWQKKLKKVFDASDERPHKRQRRDAFSSPDNFPYDHPQLQIASAASAQNTPKDSGDETQKSVEEAATSPCNDTSPTPPTTAGADYIPFDGYAIDLRPTPRHRSFISPHDEEEVAPTVNHDGDDTTMAGALPADDVVNDGGTPDSAILVTDSAPSEGAANQHGQRRKSSAAQRRDLEPNFTSQ
ncbi:hypothetical protein BDZ85DRAFT_259756 [Elsinoe ampelina]|uniref:Uncharacterized protein n=1 Tax=Elsinoe ampelina TaxID=302913 RepID=A0A6A6GHF3_9PEZI|nr:hypothetical protein BDZ85DRAFT_259756 [Elsinoe ampelina]